MVIFTVIFTVILFLFMVIFTVIYYFAQLLAVVIFVSISLKRENLRGLRENLKHKIRTKESFPLSIGICCSMDFPRSPHL